MVADRRQQKLAPQPQKPRGKQKRKRLFTVEQDLLLTF
jgi:hypothetical protein